MTTRRQRLLAERYDRSDLASDPVELPDKTVDRRQRIKVVRSALTKLSDRDRQMLLMREEGFRYREIAAVVNVAPASVGTLLARAVRRFEKALDPVYIEDESNSDD